MAKPSSTPKIATKKHIARLERERRQVRLVWAIFIATIALVVFLVGYGILDQNYFKVRQPVAEVNGEKIPLNYWQERIQMQRIQLYNQYQTYQYYQQYGIDTSQQQQQLLSQLQLPETLGQQVLDQLIDEALIKQEAQKRGITVTPAEVEAKIQTAAFNFAPGGTPTPTITPTDIGFPTLTNEQLLMYPPTFTPTPFMSPTPTLTSTPDLSVTPTLTSTPAPSTPTPLPMPATATATPYTIDGFNTQYKTALDNLKKLGISEATFRATFESQVYREKMFAVITKDTPTTEEEVLARHILVSDAVTAATVEALLANGMDFARAARLYSKDSGSAVKGGELGWNTKDGFVPEFGVAAFEQPIGEIGKPVKSQYGYHIIQVIARQQMPLSASQLEQKKNTAFTDWLTKLRDDGTKAGKITTYDFWKTSIPPMPTTIPIQPGSTTQP